MDAGFAVLVIDDHVELALNLQDILQDEGYQVRAVHDGQSAIGACMEDIFDLAIVDIKLPDIPGVELVRRLSDGGTRMDYVLITGFASLDSAIEAVSEQAVLAYETKPLDMRQFLPLVKQISERRQAEKALQRNRARLRLLVEQTPCILWITDTDFRYTSLMGAGLSMFNTSPSALVGSKVGEWEKKDQAGKVLRAHRKAFGGVATTYEFQVSGRAFHCCVEPFRDVSGVISGVVGMAVDITDRKESEEHLRQLSQRLVEIQEVERRSLACELHDQVGQDLTALKLLLHRAHSAGGADAERLLSEAGEVVTELIARVRNLSLELRPQMLDDLGLLSALLWHFERYSQRTGIKVKFRHSGLRHSLSQELSTGAYRIIQEALNNVARHAGTGEVSVRAWVSHKSLCVCVEDSGKGFDISQATTGVGLRGMQERAMLLGGTLAVVSKPGSGTCLKAELPIYNSTNRPRKQCRL